MRGRALTATTLAAACSTAVARSSDRAWRVLERSRREADMRERDLGSGFVREDGGAAPWPVLDVRAGRAARHFQQHVMNPCAGTTSTSWIHSPTAGTMDW